MRGRRTVEFVDRGKQVTVGRLREVGLPYRGRIRVHHSRHPLFDLEIWHRAYQIGHCRGYRSLGGVEDKQEELERDPSTGQLGVGGPKHVCGRGTKPPPPF